MNETLATKSVNDLIYVIPAAKWSKTQILSTLQKHPEIKFVSLVGIDLGGNDTDERIPIQLLIDDYDAFIRQGVQTDGSSVILPEIATLNNAKVDLVPDCSVNWYVDYNYDHIDDELSLPIGTLRIPSFLDHDGKRIDSRSILTRAEEHFKNKILKLIEENDGLKNTLGFRAEEVDEILLTSATELEFWVKTPGNVANIEELSVSQVLKEQYWKRTQGSVRTAMEQSLLMLERYGLEPEMGHKEVGGVTAQIIGGGRLDHIMEQLEIDWKYSLALQTADNELLARIVIKETFRRNGLDLTFMAKPIEGAAGNGKHTHVGVAVKLKSGKTVNLFAPENNNEDFLSKIGWGALMGLLKNYEVVNPFITATNDAFNRLKPGFEAPVCTVASIGHNVNTPSRNRTVLVGLIRDMQNPLAHRFEVRSPNPYTNTHLTLAALYQAMLDGIKAVIESGKATKELEQAFSKTAGQESFYLEKDRAYRSEKDVFEHYTAEERNSLFGTPPATVWDNLQAFNKYLDKTKVLLDGAVFTKQIISSYSSAIHAKWATELYNRIIPENMVLIRSFKRLHAENNGSGLDQSNWEKINYLRHYLAKNSVTSKSLFARIREALDSREYNLAARLQLEMSEKISELKNLYWIYKRNLIDNYSE